MSLISHLAFQRPPENERTRRITVSERILGVRSEKAMSDGRDQRPRGPANLPFNSFNRTRIQVILTL